MGIKNQSQKIKRKKERKKEKETVGLRLRQLSPKRPNGREIKNYNDYLNDKETFHYPSLVIFYWMKFKPIQ